MTDLNELERLARAATPGPWKACDGRGPGVAVFWDAPEQDDNFVFYDETGGRHRDAAYIAAASPNVVLQLIARVRELERRNLVLRCTARDLADGKRFGPAPIQRWMMTLAWVGLAQWLGLRCYQLGLVDGLHGDEDHGLDMIDGQLRCMAEDIGLMPWEAP